MKLRVKIALCLFLVLFAAASLMVVFQDLGVLQPKAETVPAAAEPGYELRIGGGGYVALFSPPDSAEPVGLTDIPAAGLPLTDRLALAKGIRVQQYEDVVRLLEDFGP